MDGIDRSGVVGGGKQFAESTNGLWASTAVEKQERLTLTVFVDGDVDGADAVKIHGVCGSGHGFTLVIGPDPTKSVAGTVAYRLITAIVASGVSS